MNEAPSPFSACARCVGIIRNQRAETGHTGLVEVDSSVQRRDGLPALHRRRYQCLACGTCWQQIDDPADSRLGWSVELPETS